MGKPAATDRPCLTPLSHSFTLDFIITSRSKEALEGEIKPLVEQFLHERGLELSPAKTVITHVEKGFDFLGQNVRKYPNGNCSSSLPRRTFKPSWAASGRQSKPRWGRRSDP